LRAGGVRRARKRVARLLRAAGRVGGHRRRRARTTVTEPPPGPAPHLMARDCAAPAVDRRWSGASTASATAEGRRSLAVRLDAHARRVIGRALADHRRTARALDARALARRNRRPGAGRVPHTARGSPYTAAADRARCAGRRCATRKAAPVDTRRWTSRATARTALFAWLAVGDHRRRRHAARGDHRPVAHEERMMLLHDLAAWRYGVRISGPTSRALAPLREQVTEVRGVLCQRGGGGRGRSDAWSWRHLLRLFYHYRPESTKYR